VVGQDHACPQLESGQQQLAESEKLGNTGWEGRLGGCAVLCSEVPCQIWPEVPYSSFEEGV